MSIIQLAISEPAIIQHFVLHSLKSFKIIMNSYISDFHLKNGFSLKIGFHSWIWHPTALSIFLKNINYPRKH